MDNILYAWASRWGVSNTALLELRAMLGGLDAPPPVDTGLSEAAVQSRVRVAGSRLGMRLWRNNVGAFQDPDTGAFVRFGLANDSPAMNKQLKSADLIGIRPRVVTPADVGKTIGQFVSYECKRGDWKWSGTEREKAQAAWAALVTSLGGEARFINDARAVV